MNTTNSLATGTRVAAILSGAACLVACERAPAPEAPGAQGNMASEGATAPMRGAPQRASVTDAETSDLLARHAFETVVGLVTEFRHRQNWNAVEEWAIAFGWASADERYLQLLNAEMAFIDSRQGEWVLVGCNPTADALSVMVPKAWDHAAKVEEWLKEISTLQKLGTFDELDSTTAVYVAALGGERIGLFSVAWSSPALGDDRMLTIGFVGPEEATKASPKLEGAFRTVEEASR